MWIVSDMDLDESYDGYVESGLWNYWHLHYFTNSPIRVTVSQYGDSGDCDLYIKQNSDPTRILYQFSDISLDHEYSIVIQSPGDEVWHLGVYGWTTCSYTITAELVGK